jgi:formylglycine-generating enzyme required for sulfatase activity
LLGAFLAAPLILRLRTSEGTLELTLDPPDAELLVVGDEVTVKRPEREPVVIRGLPGERTLKIRKGGFEAQTQDITLVEGERKVLEIRLVPDRAIAAKPPGGDESSHRPVASKAPAGDESSERPGKATIRMDNIYTSPAPVASLRPAPLDCTGPDGVSAAEVRRAQEAWAQYLGRQVEETVPIANGVAMTFVLIPPGKFRMGSPDGEADRSNDETLHTVELTQPFDLAKCEVTQGQYQALTGTNPSNFKGGDLPVEKVSWQGAGAFGSELTKKRQDRHVYRLPTEAEWEYSCRGGRPSSQPFGIGDGRSLSSREANFDGNSPYGTADKGPYLEATCKVGSYAANALGLYDMHGNVWEWCADRFGPYPSEEVTQNPMGPSNPAQFPDRVIRGGSWDYLARHCRAALRRRTEPGSQYDSLGFRLARSIPSGGPASKPANSTGRDQGSVPSKPEAPVARSRPAPLDCTGSDGVSAEEIRTAQQAWAQYLGRQVEETVPIANGVPMTFVLVPPGKFRMGSPENEAARYEDETLHTVVLTESFYLGKYEVTQAQYHALTGKNPSHFKGDDRPVEQVSWEEADAFGKELTKKRDDRCVYRLPSEAEWEYSCRGGRSSSQPFGIGDGRSFSSREANIVGDKPYGTAQKGPYRQATCKVGSYPANALGLYDMHGNVWEWCADRHGSYTSEEVTNPAGPSDPAEAPARVFRGGCWFNYAESCRAGRRCWSFPGYSRDKLGFRLARSVPSPSK